ncbi:hypothetical protein EXU48_18130 [Occultella glacieicola]|uniref:Uncharacterized protein n=1 Tax=Occultella glacieicola TaxID=2518684 RepID=A0ABY2DZZ1_9MICO|nr:hypothetical protein EXU48_18130 [Occultella glacieicola]
MAGGHYAAENLPAAPPSNHGRTVAGWTLFWAGVVGSLVVGVAFILQNVTLGVIGGVVIVAGCVASAILRAVGYGQIERNSGRNA